MTVNFTGYFFDNTFDERILFHDFLKTYTVGDVKKVLENEINGEDNFSFILKYIKNIIKNPEYTLDFMTSGTSGSQKCVKKSLLNLTQESLDIFNALKLEDNLEFITTTSPNHLFGATFYMMLPLNSGYIINTSKINYPEDLVIENAALITTPSFLESMRKYNAEPPVKPHLIITAGAKLQDETFEYAQTISHRVIEIYGSTETGIIAYRDTPKTKRLKLFRGIKILSADDEYTKISTKYSLNPIQSIGDRLKVFGDEIEFLGRNDRLLKVLEKRISAEDMEKELCKNKFINECYCFEYSGKIAAIAALSKSGEDYAIENGSFELSKELKKSLQNSFDSVPQKWAFTDEIPKTTSGKINKNIVKDIFNTNLTMPLILSRNVEDTSAVFELCFLKNSNFFQGHFENFPILPGVVQLFYANYFSNLVFNVDCKCGQIRRIKFTNIIFPSKKILLKLTKKDQTIEFKYYDSNKTYSSGILPITSLL